ncbi:MAG TPA: xanthine dehydrogenase family protein molybdopterin-binding subunit, partial [Kiloniellales bacterium]|nr:xanthine dehydrogenase family protein molybdopterin-binding subunit [Kiloniellales bacterium]
MVQEHGRLGDSVVRIEDERFLTGRGSYTGDLRLDGEARAVVVRSDHAHARIRGLDIKAARAAPGVLAVLTGEDVAADGLGVPVCLRPVPDPDGSPMYEPPRPLLNRTHVRYVGDPIAFVVAETLAQAKDAAELITVDYDPLPAVTTLREVLADGAPAIRPERPDNRCFRFEAGDAQAVASGFAEADRVVSLELDITRVQPAPIEPRGALGHYDAEADRYTLYAGIQSPHRAKTVLAKTIFKIPPERIRVVSPDVGGAFGNRNSAYPELSLVLWASRRLGRPVRWISERGESFLCDDQGRDNLTRAELALDSEGNFLAMRVKTAVSLGAYVASNGPGPAVNNIGGLAGVYRTPAIHVTVEGYFTNTVTTSAYRGAGRPEATYVVERLIDKAARELGVDRIALRERNMIRPEDLPFKTGLVFTYDSGDFPKGMAKALSLADHQGFAARREEARRRGRLRGFGLANPIESAGSPNRDEFARIAYDAEGRVRLLVGTHSHGQGHETLYRQLLGDLLGTEFNSIEMVQGDTDVVADGGGTFGSRSMTLGGGAIKAAAAAVIERAKALAADHFEAAAADIEFADGVLSVVGTDRRIAITELARLAAERDEPLEGDATYKPDAATFPNGCHTCEVEIDPNTGEVEILRYVVVDDFGRVLNPLLVDGQVHGGVVQGIGQVMMEQIRWDPESGQLLTGSFMDYAMPRAADVPGFEVAMNPHPTPKNSLGVKGAGEAGCVGALGCVMNAVHDALAE